MLQKQITLKFEPVHSIAAVEGGLVSCQLGGGALLIPWREWVVGRRRPRRQRAS